MTPDKEGFLFPQVNQDLCVNCGQCENVCPALNPFASRRPLEVVAAKAKDDELRMRSSSGGMFTLLAQDILSRGGVVFGAGFDRHDWHVMHKAAHTKDDLDELRRSKYVQSDVGETFVAVQAELNVGREVMFVGTPCQVAGLNHLVKHPNLLTVDFICHAIPSPLVWRKFLDGVERTADSKITYVSFRTKSHGWREYVFEFRFANGTVRQIRQADNYYLKAFFGELCNRLSCFTGHCRDFRSGSDLTLSDFWNVEKVCRSLSDNLGVSTVFIHTEKGRAQFDRIKSLTENAKVGYDQAFQARISSAKAVHRNRSRFFRKLRQHVDFDEAVIKCLKVPFVRRCLSKFAITSVLLGRIVGGMKRI